VITNAYANFVFLTGDGNWIMLLTYVLLSRVIDLIRAPST